MLDLTGIGVLVVGVVVVLLLVGLLFARNYVKVPPNTVAVFTGRGVPKTVRGGARFRVPVIERVDTMSLEPFNVEVQVSQVYSSDSVPVSVNAVGLIKFGSTDHELATAVERFLTSNRDSLQRQVSEILAGSLRSIVSQMTVEELNSNRDQLTSRVLEEASSAFGPIGMKLDVLTVQSISDQVGYLEALGRKRTAEVKSAARIGEAEAEREAQIRSAQAQQQGAVAKAKAEEAIAEAQQQLDLKRAAIAQQVDAANARAAQSGPLAEAEAQRAVVLAGVETEQRRNEAQIAVEQRRADRVRQAQQADVVIPAEAAREAAVAAAQADKAAAIARGEAEAETRKLAAAATQRELEAKAEGDKAAMLARAEGELQLAASLKAYSAEAARLNLLPQVLAMLPKLAEAAAGPVGNIDRLVVLDGGGGAGGTDGLSRVAGLTPALIARTLEAASAAGVDLGDLLRGALGPAHPEPLSSGPGSNGVGPSTGSSRRQDVPTTDR